MRKRIVRTFAGLLILTAFTLPACDFLEDCGECEFLQDDGTEVTVVSAALPYCGDSFYDKLNSESVTENGVTTYWNCN